MVLGLKERRESEGVKSWGCTEEAAYVNMREYDVLLHVVIVELMGPC